MTRHTFALDSGGYLIGTPTTMARPWFGVLTVDPKRPERMVRQFAEYNGKRQPHAALWRVGTAIEMGSKGQIRRWYGVVIDTAPGVVVLEERPSWQAALGVTMELPEPAKINGIDALLVEQAALLARLADIGRRLVAYARGDEGDADFDVDSMEVSR